MDKVQQFIIRLQGLAIANNLTWVTPHVTLEREGEVSIEWWKNNSVLTVFVDSAGQIEYLKAWGPHIWREMEEGINPTDQELLNLYNI